MTLEVERLTVMIGDTAVVEEVTFRVGKGQRLGLIGDSGSGKTMTALAVMGMLPEGAEATGKIAFDGSAMPPDEAGRALLRGRRIGLISEDAADALDPLRTAIAQVLEAMELAGRTVDLDKEAASLFRDVGLDADRARLYPHQLMVSERQRVAIAAALAGSPELLICDVPTANLDLIAQRRILDLIDKACRERSMSLILISHDLKAVAAMCELVVVLKDGRVVESGPKMEVFGRPKHEFTRSLMTTGRHRARTLMRTPIGGDLLAVRHVGKRYRLPDVAIWEPRPQVVALDNVSFSVRRGESLAVMGPTGSGKSTIARIAAGLDDATEGELQFGEHIYRGTDLPPIARPQISLVSADPALEFDPRVQIAESISEPLRLETEHDVEELGRRIGEVMTAVGLPTDLLTRYPVGLSPGDRQRLAIARALISRPRLVVLDEPIAALDVSARGEILAMLNRLRADYGLTFLVVGHDLEMIRLIADRVIVMDKGRIIETATPAQLLESPQQALTRELVAASLPDVGIVPV